MRKSRGLIGFLLAAALWGQAGSLYQNFQNPPADYSLMPYWYWNGTITPAETRHQISEMIAQGVHAAIVFPWDGMKPRYLSEEYWKELGAALDIARELHFTLNLADEYLWPSGHAWDFGSERPELSRVLQMHPEFRMKRIELAPETPEGFRLVPAIGAHNTRVDLLNPDAVKAYVDLVYEELARRFPQHLGKTLQITVADHEGAYGAQIAWTPRLWSEFQKRYGYDLRPKLSLLARDSAESRRVRTDYLNLISDLYARNYTGQVADWCAKHGIRHGTSAYEEQLYIQVNLAGDMFKIWRSGRVVEIDALLERARMPIDFKEAVSVSHFDGKPLLVENQGLQGHDTFFSLEKARLGTNMALVWGANRLIPYFDYDHSKLTWPPQWFLGQPAWRYFHHYADYVRRAQFMNAQGRHIAPVAIYYPLETAFAESGILFTSRPHRDLVWNSPMDQIQGFYSALQLQLARAGWDYHILDRHYLQQAVIRDRALHVADESFRVLILPPMTEMEPRSVEQVKRFVAAGGTVFALGSLPHGLDEKGLRRFPVREHPLFMDRLNYMEQIQVPAGIQEDLRPLLDALRAVEPPQLDARGLFFSHRRAGDLDWYWVVNDSAEERDLKLPGRWEKWDAETGARRALGEAIHFGPWDAFFLVGNDRAAPAAPRTERVLLALPNTGWTLTPEAERLLVPYQDRVWLAPERLSHRNWYIRGPYPYDDHEGFFRPYPPESEPFRADEWKLLESPTYSVTLPREKGIYYAHAEVDSPSARRGVLLAAFADSLKVWWNGRLALDEHRHPKWLLMRDTWAERRPIEIRKGRNTVLLKIEPSLMTRTVFLFRITEESGATMRDLTYTPSDKPDNAPEQPIAYAPTAMPFTLHSWTDDPKLAWFSGTALYETKFDLPEAVSGQKLTLDLGAVGVAAEAWVNGRKAGERAWRPFRFDVTGLVRPGSNVLRIRIANSDANWQCQGDTIYPKGSWGLRFNTERDRLPLIRPNGLEGPVRIVVSDR